MFPCSLTKTFARLPSSAATTYSWITRLPAFIFEHMGSMPIRITGFPGRFPVRRTRPLIVPVLVWANAAGPARQASNKRAARTLNLFALFFTRRRRRLVLVRIPVLQMALFTSLVDTVARIQQSLFILRFDCLEGCHCG